MKDVIGNILQELLLKPGAPTRLYVAGELNMSDKTLYSVTRGKSHLTLDQIVKASELFGIDIIEEYYSRTGLKFTEPSEIYKPAKNVVTVNLSLTGSISTYDKFGELLLEIKNLAKQRGFDIA